MVHLGPAMQEAEVTPLRTPIDMALNHGTYCSRRCLDVLRRYDGITSLRIYPSESNTDLIETIARIHGVSAENILVDNGSGPILKTVIPFLIERNIRSSALRMIRYSLKRKAYPIFTPRFTYSKVPLGSLRHGLRCEWLPLNFETKFSLDLADMKSRLRASDGLVYLANPNNPTGNVLITPEQLRPLLSEFPESWFFIDEAYLEYLPEREQLSVGRMVADHENLVVLRSFSFAYGLASTRIGYAVLPKSLMKHIEPKQTPHRVGQLAAELAMAALGDDEHLPFVERMTAAERAKLIEGMTQCDALQPVPSQTNFILCRVRLPWTARRIYDELMTRGIKVKVFEQIGEERYEDYFRVTVGLDWENARFLEELFRIFKVSPPVQENIPSIASARP
jgi:histidinol-phosphate aminotransferase